MEYDDLPLLTDILIHKIPNQKCWFGIQFGNIELSFQARKKLSAYFSNMFESGVRISKWLLNNTMVIYISPGLLLRHALDQIREKYALISAHWQLLHISSQVRFGS